MIGESYLLTSTLQSGVTNLDTEAASTLTLPVILVSTFHGMENQSQRVDGPNPLLIDFGTSAFQDEIEIGPNVPMRGNS